jgi:hypothetical protein
MPTATADLTRYLGPHEGLTLGRFAIRWEADPDSMGQEWAVEEGDDTYDWHATRDEAIADAQERLDDDRDQEAEEARAAECEAVHDELTDLLCEVSDQVDRLNELGEVENLRAMLKGLKGLKGDEDDD